MVRVAGLLQLIAFVAAILYAKGWFVSVSFANSLALIALGLLIPILAAALTWAPTMRPKQSPPAS